MNEMMRPPVENMGSISAAVTVNIHIHTKNRASAVASLPSRCGDPVVGILALDEPKQSTGKSGSPHGSVDQRYNYAKNVFGWQMIEVLGHQAMLE